MKLTSLLTILFLLSFATTGLKAQDKPIGYWRSHMPYNTAISIASGGNTIYTATDLTFYTYNTASGELNTYSKVEGMSDVDMKYVAYDATTATAVLAYKNCNIDLFKNNTFYNVPDLKIKTVAGNKIINSIYTENGLAYLSATIGIVVIDIENREVKETYVFTQNGQTIGINGMTALGNNFYAATTKGLFRANKNAPNLQAFSAWTQLDSTHNLTGITTAGGKVFAITDSSAYVVQGDTLARIYTTATNKILHVDPSGNDNIWLSVYKPASFNGVLLRLNTSYQITDSLHTAGEPAQTIDLSDGHTWYADVFIGLKRHVSGDVFDFDSPNGPGGQLGTDIFANNKTVLVASAGVTDVWVPTVYSGYSEYKDDKWTYYPNETGSLTGMTHVITVYKDLANDTKYIGTARDGMLIINPDGSTQKLKENSPLDHSVPNGDWWQVTGETQDSKGNLWVTMFGSAHELSVKTTDGHWYSYIVPVGRPYPNSAARVITDDNDQLWYICSGGGGVMVYNYNNTPELASDDSYRNLRAGTGSGNLPNNIVYSIVKDKSGSIWVGTADGIGIINCPSEAIAGTCEAERRIVQYDEFAGYLFQGEAVKALAVDGGDRKWVGTSNGVWLLSPDASKIIYRFTVDNSPLPSNNISRITIDPVTGDVYIGTDKGLICYRSTAVDGGEKNDNVLAFPNPVPANYTGTIAVKGLVDNADVRITDISGQLIYRTTALGGQAVWNGLDYTGRKPQSGVYLVFISNKDGSQKHVGKIVFMN